MKKGLSLLLAVLTVLSVLTVSVSASEPEPLLVYDTLKYDADAQTRTCRTIEILFQAHLSCYDDTKEITIRDAQDEIVAVCKPYADNNRKFDLYTPDGVFGVRFDPVRLYYLTIPAGTYYADKDYPCAAYCGEYTGVFLTNTGDYYTITGLGISDFLATDMSDNILYAGRLRFSAKFTTLLCPEKSVKLLRKDGDYYVTVGVYPIASFRRGRADVAFDGVEIDRYATYKLRVNYGTFSSGSTTINGHSEYVLSGKRLLGLRENYPAIDLLIKWFGADHWTLKAVATVLGILAKIKLVDSDLADDIKHYIDMRKSA